MMKRINELLDELNLKLESPSKDEIRDRLIEGEGLPRFALKSRHPTTQLIALFNDERTLEDYLEQIASKTRKSKEHNEDKLFVIAAPENFNFLNTGLNIFLVICAVYLMYVVFS